MKESVVRFYVYFYNKVSGRVASGLKDTELKMIDKFLVSIGSSAGESFLFKYMCYQFYYWHNLDTRLGKGIIPIAWVVGDKAFKRWSDGDHWYQHSAVLHTKFGILRSDLIKVVPEGILLTYDNEEKDKALYYNTAKGLIFCSDYTSMYHPNSPVCKSCVNSSDCIDIMKRTLSSVYKNRMEAFKG